MNQTTSISLVNLDARAGYDLDRPPPIGSVDEVRRAIVTALRSRGAMPFNERGEARCTGRGYWVQFAIGADSPVCEVEVTSSGPEREMLAVVRDVCGKTGWTAYDRDSGRFLDLHVANPFRPPTTTRPFYWWRALPSPVRVILALGAGLLILNSYLAEMAARLAD